jgi:hypothetical protein
MSYDAREYLNALTPPTFVDQDGGTHVGRILSHHEVSVNLVKLQAIALRDVPMNGKSADEIVDAVEATFREILGTMFDADVVEQVLRLPPEGVQEAMMDFLGSQRRPRPQPGMAQPVADRPVAVPRIPVGTG